MMDGCWIGVGLMSESKAGAGCCSCLAATDAAAAAAPVCLAALQVLNDDTLPSGGKGAATCHDVGPVRGNSTAGYGEECRSVRLSEKRRLSWARVSLGELPHAKTVRGHKTARAPNRRAYVEASQWRSLDDATLM
jgi:hypothetical protein